MLKKIKSHIKFAIASVVLTLSLVTGGVAYSQPVLAAGPVDVLNKCNSQSRVCAGTDKDSLYGLLKNIINLLLVVIGIISVIMIIIGGFRYTTSAGDAGQTKSARDTIIYAVVGLVIAIMSYAIVNFVLREL